MRLFLKIPMIMLLLTLVFFILRALPEDPISVMLGPRVSPEQRVEIRERLGLDEPLIVQYLSYIGGLLRCDLGESLLTRKPVLSEILERFPATLELVIFSFLLAFILGLLLGVLSVRKRGSVVDAVLRFCSIVAYALPVFWLAMMFQLLFGIKLEGLPISGRISPLMEPNHITGLYILDSLLTLNLSALLNALKHLFLPSFALVIVLFSAFFRTIRESMIEIMRMDFITSAIARGLPEKSIFYRYVLRNALISVAAMLGPKFALLLGGTVLIENIFSWPGLGTLLITGIRYGDLVSVQGVLVFYVLFVALFGLIGDIVRAYVDPRVRGYNSWNIRPFA